ncbi:MAG: lysophospholipase [Bdellovibrionales bacterium]
MSTRFEGTLKSLDQTEIFFQLWAADKPRGTIIITHGQAEHSECYHPFAKTLQADGWESYGFDFRGHGRSEGKRGYVAQFKEYVADLRAVVEMVARERKNQSSPLILFGHSMGGLVTTLLAMEWKNPPFQALALSSPLYEIAVPVPQIKDMAARMLLKWAPSVTLHNELKYSDLSRDEAMLKSYEHDVLRHDKISAAVYIGMLESFKNVREQAHRIELPTLMMLAGNDKIVSTPVAQEIFALLPNKKNVMELYPESYHEIFNDLDRDQAFADLRKFINQFQGST